MPRHNGKRSRCCASSEAARRRSARRRQCHVGRDEIEFGLFHFWLLRCATRQRQGGGHRAPLKRPVALVSPSSSGIVHYGHEKLPGGGERARSHHAEIIALSISRPAPKFTASPVRRAIEPKRHTVTLRLGRGNRLSSRQEGRYKRELTYATP